MQKVVGPTVVGDGNFEVLRTESGFRVSIARKDGSILGVEAVQGSEQDAKDTLLDLAKGKEEKDRVEAAFAAPWTQA